MEKDWPALAGVLLNSLGDRVAEQGRPTWVRILDAPDAPGAFDMDLDDSPDGLLGWVAPAECLGVGVVATGRVTREEDPEDSVPGARPAGIQAGTTPGARPAGIQAGTTPGARPAGIQAGTTPGARPAGIRAGTTPGDRPAGIQAGTTPGVRLACLVSRDGQVGWRMTAPGGLCLDAPPTEGRLLDCLRRCFELPTPPPPAGAARVQLVVWLLTVRDTIRRTRRQLTWREVAELHPVAALRADPALQHAGPAVIPELIRIAGQAWSWEDLRQGAVHGAWGDDVVTPELAAWMDEGMFARWILSELPAPEELVDQVRPHVSTSTARRLAHVVRAAA